MASDPHPAYQPPDTPTQPTRPRTPTRREDAGTQHKSAQWRNTRQNQIGLAIVYSAPATRGVTPRHNIPGRGRRWRRRRVHLRRRVRVRNRAVRSRPSAVAVALSEPVRFRRLHTRTVLSASAVTHPDARKKLARAAFPPRIALAAALDAGTMLATGVLAVALLAPLARPAHLTRARARLFVARAVPIAVVHAPPADAAARAVR
jgi:hypothetical protein